jgi:hypothetical protein
MRCCMLVSPQAFTSVLPPTDRFGLLLSEPVAHSASASLCAHMARVSRHQGPSIRTQHRLALTSTASHSAQHRYAGTTAHGSAHAAAAAALLALSHCCSTSLPAAAAQMESCPCSGPLPNGTACEAGCLQFEPTVADPLTCMNCPHPRGRHPVAMPGRCPAWLTK